MVKFILSRTLLLSILSFFLGWAIKSYDSEQLFIFFGVHLWDIFHAVIFVLILLFGALVLNFTFTILYWREYSNAQFLTNREKRVINRFQLFDRLVLDFKFTIIGFAFGFERQREKYPESLFLGVLLFFNVLYFQGSPFINNYCAIYGEFEFEGMHDLPVTRELSGIVVRNDKVKAAEDKLLESMPDYVDDVGHKKYIYMEAALIDGYLGKLNHNGLFPYLKCLSYYALEKGIDVLIYFLLPYFTVILFLELRYRKDVRYEKILNLVKKEMVLKVQAVNSVKEIVEKYELSALTPISDALLAFGDGKFEKKAGILAVKKSWFKAKTLLISLNNFYSLVNLTEIELQKRVLYLVKTNFSNIHFSSGYEKFPVEKAKLIIDEIEAQDGDVAREFRLLLNLISDAKYEAYISDLNELHWIKEEWRKEKK
jgi:hypothetical protein